MLFLGGGEEVLFGRGGCEGGGPFWWRRVLFLVRRESFFLGEGWRSPFGREEKRKSFFGGRREVKSFLGEGRGEEEGWKVLGVGRRSLLGRRGGRRWTGRKSSLWMRGRWVKRSGEDGNPFGVRSYVERCDLC